MHFLVYFICFTLTAFSINAEESKKTVCLNMIVKNESKVITRCLSSLKPLIDYWVILDTGSTDNTQQIIKDLMKDVPGELHEDPFRNFEYSRNKALDFAKGKGDYILFIDADEVYEFDNDFKFRNLDKDFYFITTVFSGMEYGRIGLINNQLNWRWEGVLHEAVDCDDAKTSDTLVGIRNIVRTDGARSQDPQKFQKDAKVLEEALQKDPSNTRNTFYLAQSYKDAGDYQKAKEWYQKRVKQGGWDEEVFWSMYEVANMGQWLERPPEEFIADYMKAYQYRPSRIEPLYRLAHYYRVNKDYAAGYRVAHLAAGVPLSQDILFVERWMYEYGIPVELSICAYCVGEYSECREICLKALKNEKVPDSDKKYLENSLSFANRKIAEELEKEAA